jgi:hypothetical protein
MAGRSQHPVQIMENQTCFDLNAAIENWKSELSAQPNFSADDRRELETHLRDTIVGLRQRGLNDEETFWLARRRIGQPQQLGEEFVKADPAKVWRERAFGMIAAILAAFLLYSISTSLAVAVESYFPILEKIVSESILILLFWILQILGMTILFTRGTGNQQLSLLISFIQSRFHLAIISILGVLAVQIFCVTIMFLAFVGFQGVYSPMGPFAFIGKHILFSMIQDLALVALLVWLMPTQNRKTPKRA